MYANWLFSHLVSHAEWFARLGHVPRLLWCRCQDFFWYVCKRLAAYWQNSIRKACGKLDECLVCYCCCRQCKNRTQCICIVYILLKCVFFSVFCVFLSHSRFLVNSIEQCDGKSHLHNWTVYSQAVATQLLNKIKHVVYNLNSNQILEYGPEHAVLETLIGRVQTGFRNIAKLHQTIPYVSYFLHNPHSTPHRTKPARCVCRTRSQQIGMSLLWNCNHSMQTCGGAVAPPWSRCCRIFSPNNICNVIDSGCGNVQFTRLVCTLSLLARSTHVMQIHYSIVIRAQALAFLRTLTNRLCRRISRERTPTCVCAMLSSSPLRRRVDYANRGVATAQRINWKK